MLLLEVGHLPDVGVRQLKTVGHNNEFVVIVIEAVDDGDASTHKSLNGFRNAQDIRIQFFTVG